MTCKLRIKRGKIRGKIMKRKYGTYMKVLRGLVRILVVILLLLLSRVLGDNQASISSIRRKIPVPEAHKERIARQIASNYGRGPFQPSLEMKENADFLLTPAILVQEALSDDIVMTYPTE